MDKTITRETKQEGQKANNPQEPKKRRKLIPFGVGSYFIHDLFNVTCMQIVRCNSNGRSRTHIACQHNLPLYNKG